MATVTGLTAARMLAIEAASIVDGSVVGDNLILERHDGTTVNAGSVRGPVGPQGPNADVGDIKASIRTSIPGWLLMGSVLANANTTYPGLWAVVPASWKSGTTLNLPAMGDKILQSVGSGGAVGEFTGSNTKTLVAANLPPHVHAMGTHTHTMVDHAHTMGSHTHSINHDHGAFWSDVQNTDHSHYFSVNTSAAGNHAHSIPARLDPISGSMGSLGVSNAGGTISTRDSNVAGNHTHSVSGNTGGMNLSHQHSINMPTFAGTSGGSSAANTGADGGGNTGGSSQADTGNGPGTSAAFNVEQASLRVFYYIKY